jgi:hypothetical protein
MAEIKIVALNLPDEMFAFNLINLLVNVARKPVAEQRRILILFHRLLHDVYHSNDLSCFPELHETMRLMLVSIENLVEFHDDDREENGEKKEGELLFDDLGEKELVELINKFIH